MHSLFHNHCQVVSDSSGYVCVCVLASEAHTQPLLCAVHTDGDKLLVDNFDFLSIVSP